ncbi:hypothetical protein GCM10009117_01520 [Gangjinia marincola]|uniref:N-formylglutamate amidohydrolase n=1 Tax=Gangjinia marincola TaxID=578463 RepID=A0ABN1MD24_9FLAO
MSVAQMIEHIHQEKCFHAVAEDYSFTLKIEKYTHYVCGAVHDGHQFRKELWDNCIHTEYERWYEEDPCTKQMVEAMPIVIAGCDSRFEYDLNRAPENAIYEDAWGKKLWKSPLPEAVKNRSLQKHASFYKIVNALIAKLNELHDKVIVYDMHSYNWKRWDRPVPVINLGTVNVDETKYQADILSWRDTLVNIDLPHNIATTAGINDTFQGNGYFLKYITTHFEKVLVLATEFSKIYCDEENYVIYPEVVFAIKEALKKKIPAHAEAFKQRPHD